MTSGRRLFLGVGCAISLLCPASALGQDAYAMADTLVTDCFGELTDSGGEDEPYGNNEFLTFTVDAGSPLEVFFLAPVDIEPAAPGSGQPFDYLILFDGPDALSPVLDTLFGNLPSPPTYTTSGPLTVRFVSDASAQPQGFHLGWSANPPPPIPPDLSLAPLGGCPHGALELGLSDPVECDLVEWESIALAGEDGSSWTVDIGASEVLCPGTATDVLTLPLIDPIDGNCAFTLSLTLGLRDACDSVWWFPLTVDGATTTCPADPTITADVDTVCVGGCATLEAEARGCGPTALSWTGSDGSSFTGAGPWTVCPAATTTYTVQALETATGVAGSTSVTVVVLNLGATVPDTAICPGETLLLSAGTVAGTWSGPGVLSTLPWTFDPDSSGPGLHTLTFLANGTAACASETEVDVVDFQVPGAVATCPDATPFVPSTSPLGGAWSGAGFTGNTFDPAAVADAAGEASVMATYVAAGCTATTTFNVQPPAPPFLLGDVCQSEPEVPLPFNPPGGWWSGAGLSETGNSLVPDDTPPGAISLTYNMVGCNGSAAGNLLPIQAGPTSTSCPEQAAFVPFPGFFPPGGSWSGPGIAPTEDETGLYDPSLLADGQWAPLVYLAPNGCSDTLWMFNRQTAVDPSVMHVCRGEDRNALDAAEVGASPWCGTWTALDAGSASDVGDCEWELWTSSLPIGTSRVTYSVNTCTDTLSIVVHPDSLVLAPWTACLGDGPLELPAVPQGGIWSGGGVTEPTAAGAPWNWSPDAAGTGQHTVIWTSPAGCADTAAAEVESPPAWSSPLDSVLCFNTDPVPIPAPDTPGIHTAPALESWSWDGMPWVGDATSAALGSGVHTASVQWSAAACATDTSWTVTVLPALQVTLTAADVTLCAESATPATAAVSGGLGQGPGLDIAWSDGGLPLLERTLQPDSSGWWSVTVDDGCSSPASDSVFLTVLPPFDREVVFGALACHGDSTSLLLDASAPEGLLHVVEGDSLGAGPHLLEALAGQALAWTLVDPIEGCTADTTLLVPGHPPLTAAFSVSPALDCIPWDAQPVGLIDLSSGAESGQWSWTPLQTNDNASAADSIAWSAGTNPSLTLPASGTWSVEFTVAQDAGCADTVSQTLCILPPTSIWLPDAFSPNGDGANDWLRPRGSGIARWTMAVHDRWGRRVWEGGQQDLPAGTALQPATDSGFPVGWNGEGAPAGVYAVSVEATTDGGTPISVQHPVRLVR